MKGKRVRMRGTRYWSEGEESENERKGVLE